MVNWLHWGESPNTPEDRVMPYYASTTWMYETVRDGDSFSARAERYFGIVVEPSLDLSSVMVSFVQGTLIFQDSNSNVRLNDRDVIRLMETSGVDPPDNFIIDGVFTRGWIKANRDLFAKVSLKGMRPGTAWTDANVAASPKSSDMDGIGTDLAAAETVSLATKSIEIDTDIAPGAFTVTAGTITVDAAKTLTLGGALSAAIVTIAATGALTTSGSNYSYTTTSATNVSGALTLNGSSVSQAAVTIADGGLYANGTATSNISGNLIVGAGVSGGLTTGVGTLHIDGTTTIGAGATMGSAATAYTLNMDGNLLASAGTLIAPASATLFTFSGATWNTPTTFTAGTGTSAVVFDLAGTTSLANHSIQFNAITINNGATLTTTGTNYNLTVTAATSITGSLLTNASTVSLGAGAAAASTCVAVNAGGTFTMSTGVTTIGHATNATIITNAATWTWKGSAVNLQNVDVQWDVVTGGNTTTINFTKPTIIDAWTTSLLDTLTTSASATVTQAASKTYTNSGTTTLGASTTWTGASATTSIIASTGAWNWASCSLSLLDIQFTITTGVNALTVTDNIGVDAITISTGGSFICTTAGKSITGSAADWNVYGAITLNGTSGSHLTVSTARIILRNGSTTDMYYVDVTSTQYYGLHNGITTTATITRIDYCTFTSVYLCAFFNQGFNQIITFTNCTFTGAGGAWNYKDVALSTSAVTQFTSCTYTTVGMQATSGWLVSVNTGGVAGTWDLYGMLDWESTPDAAYREGTVPTGATVTVRNADAYSTGFDSGFSTDTTTHSTVGNSYTLAFVPGTARTSYTFGGDLSVGAYDNMTCSTQDTTFTTTNSADDFAIYGGCNIAGAAGHNIIFTGMYRLFISGTTTVTVSLSYVTSTPANVASSSPLSWAHTNATTTIDNCTFTGAALGRGVIQNSATTLTITNSTMTSADTGYLTCDVNILTGKSVQLSTCTWGTASFQATSGWLMSKTTNGVANATTFMGIANASTPDASYEIADTDNVTIANATSYSSSFNSVLTLDQAEQCAALTVNASTTLDTSTTNYAFTHSGNSTVSGTLLTRASTVTSNGQMTIYSGGTIGSSNTAWTWDSNANISNQGSIQAPNASGAWTFSGTNLGFDATSATLTNNSGTLNLDKNSGQTIDVSSASTAPAFYNITISNTGTGAIVLVGCSQVFDIDGNINATSTTASFDPGSYSVYLYLAGNMTLANGFGYTKGAAGILYLNGTAAQSMVDNNATTTQDYGVITVQNTSATVTVTTMATGVFLSDTVTINASANFKISDGIAHKINSAMSITVAGTYTVQHSNFSQTDYIGNTAAQATMPTLSVSAGGTLALKNVWFRNIAINNERYPLPRAFVYLGENCNPGRLKLIKSPRGPHRIGIR